MSNSNPIVSPALTMISGGLASPALLPSANSLQSNANGKPSSLSDRLIPASQSPITVPAKRDPLVQPATEAPTKRDDNPLLGDWRGPFGTPPLDEIQPRHFAPAFDEGMKADLQQINAIATNPQPPTFENTIVALDRAGRQLSRAERVFYLQHGAHGNDALDAIEAQYSPRFAEHSLKVILNRDLFSRVDSLWQRRNELGLDAEKTRMLQVVHSLFVNEGAGLDSVGMADLGRISGRLATLTAEFAQRLKQDGSAHGLIVDHVENLAGVPQAMIDAAAEAAKSSGLEGKWLFPLSNTPSGVAFLSHADNRELRKEIFLDTVNRGRRGDENDTREVFKEILSLRLQRATLLGGKQGNYPTSAHQAMQDRVVKKPEELYAFLDKIREPALKAVAKERDELQKLMNDDGVPGKLQPWDWQYYANRVSKLRFKMDESKLRPYFELSRVRDGMFHVAKKLFNLDIVERNDITKYHDDVQTFEVSRDGQHVGVIYFDFFARPSKQGGAWKGTIRRQSAGIRPIVYNALNIPKPVSGQPALVGVGNVKTMFHEFGHGLHGLLSNVNFETLAGTSVPRDFVEMPSQIFEQWALQPEVLQVYAKHHKTGETIPTQLVEKLEQAGSYGQGFAMTSYLAAAYLDLDWHSRDDAVGADADAFEAAAMKRFGLPTGVWPRYQSSNFSHIFSGGYWAGYGAYAVAEMMDADGFELFRKNGIFDEETAKKFNTLLSSGNTKEAMQLFVDFRGREPAVEPLLRRKGFLD